VIPALLLWAVAQATVVGRPFIPPGGVVMWGPEGGAIATRVPTVAWIDGPLPLSYSMALKGVTAMSAGAAHGLLVHEDGSLVGINLKLGIEGVENVETGPERVGALDASPLCACASAGWACSFSVRRDGTVTSAGVFENGQPALVEPGLRSIAAISAGWNHVLAVKSDGTVIGWGDGTTLPAARLTGVVAICAGRDAAGHDLALRRDGSLVEWDPRGGKDNDLCPYAPKLTNAVAISAGWGHNLAVLSDGTVLGWGANTTGGATGVTAQEAGGFSDAALVTVGGILLTNVRSVAAGYGFSLALKRDGTVAAWGAFADCKLPVVVPQGLRGASAVAAGYSYCLVSLDFFGPRSRPRNPPGFPRRLPTPLQPSPQITGNSPRTPPSPAGGPQ